MTTNYSHLTHAELLAKVAELEMENNLLKENNSLFPISELAFDIKDVVALMPGNIFWKNRSGVYLGCNNNLANFLGFSSPDEIIGKRNCDFMTEEQAQALDEIDEEIYRSGGKYIEEQGLDQNSNPTYFLTHKIPLKNTAGKIIGMFGISLDISEMKRIEKDLKIAKEEAEAASKAKSEFVANMSHDVKTPLSGMIGLAELLTYRLKRQDNLEFAETILTSGQQLLNFFDNCLEVFKLDTTNIMLVKEEFNLKNTINDIIDLYQPAIKTKFLIFDLEYSDAVPEYVKGSRAGIYRVLLNLIGNAVKFTNQGSINVRVNVSEQLDSKNILVQFSIIDTGLGIPKDKHNIIFDRFTRLTPSYKGIYEGSGIGLYIVQKYVESMEGKIHVHSEVGKGSAFHIQIPLEISSRPTKENPIAEKKSLADFMSLHARILLVEDNLTAQLIESSLLASINCEVQIAESGEKALELFEPGNYDLILMDIGLPGLQGDAVARLIRKMELGTNFHVPIVALTAHITQEMKQELLSAGIEDVYNKPLLLEQAQEIVERFYLERAE